MFCLVSQTVCLAHCHLLELCLFWPFWGPVMMDVSWIEALIVPGSYLWVCMCGKCAYWDI